MNLHVETCGTGPDLALLHGWGMHGGVWDGVRGRLARHFRLHLVDLPGHGYSPACTPGTLRQMAGMVAETLPANCTVCGWSLGGLVALELALIAPERVARLALVATTPCFIWHEDWPWGTEPALLQQFSEALRQDYAATLKRFIALQVRGGSNTAAALAQLRASLLQRAEPGPAALQTGLQILLATDLREQVREIGRPVLLLHGQYDAIVAPAAVEWMSRQLPDAELVMLPRCGHVPFLSHPDQFVASLLGMRG